MCKGPGAGELRAFAYRGGAATFPAPTPPMRPRAVTSPQTVYFFTHKWPMLRPQSQTFWIQILTLGLPSWRLCAHSSSVT